MTGLQSARRGPSRADAVVVFLHGYGADGADLLGLADPLAPHLPGVAFHAPDAPQRSRNNPFGFQWFPVPWLDGSTEAEAREAMARSTAQLDEWLDGVLAAEGLGADRLVVVGFSQGTMMALHVLPRRDAAAAGIVGFSGRLLAPDLLAAEVRSRPPVILLHGDADPVVPFGDMARAAAVLEGAGFSVRGHVMKGTGHGISPDGMMAALAFVRERLGK